MTASTPIRLARLLCTLLALSLLAPAWAQAQRQPAARSGDHIVAIVNQELVTSAEVQARLARLREATARAGDRAPTESQLQRQALDDLIEERVILSYARETGTRVDEPELERAVASVAAQNQLTVPQLRDRLRQEGLDYARFRNQIRDQILVERVREREVQSRIRITDADIDRFIDTQRRNMPVELNLAQILVTVPEGAGDAVVAERRARAEQALKRVRGGEDFATVARQLSEDGNRDKGGEIGLRPADRLPEVFVQQVRDVKTGEVAPTLLRTGAGFHVLKVVERREGGSFRVTQTHARHILLRASPQQSNEAAVRRLAELKREIERGSRRFEQVAAEVSEDGTAERGGDLGWVSPGMLVPEFEEAMNRLPPNGISDPVVSRFGVHLIQVLERREVTLEPKQVRDQARAALREQKFEEAYNEWVRDLRARAYIELRDPPQ